MLSESHSTELLALEGGPLLLPVFLAVHEGCEAQTAGPAAGLPNLPEHEAWKTQDYLDIILQFQDFILQRFHTTYTVLNSISALSSERCKHLHGEKYMLSHIQVKQALKKQDIYC